MPLHYSKEGPIATFTIDNGKVNVFTPDMHKTLFEALTDFASDPAIRVGVMNGAKGGSFCAGDDIKMVLPALSPQQALEAHFSPHIHDETKGLGRPGWEQNVMRIKRIKPIVGAVDFYCLGQGLIYLLLLTDIRYATARAEFGFPEIAYGMGGAGGMTRLGRHVPEAIAMEMLLLGKHISAPKALDFHLINGIVEPERLLPVARAAAERIASHPPVAVQLELDAYHRAMDMTREQAMDYSGTLFRFQRVAYDGPGAGTGSFRKGEEIRA